MYIYTYILLLILQEHNRETCCFTRNSPCRAPPLGQPIPRQRVQSYLSERCWPRGWDKEQEEQLSSPASWWSLDFTSVTSSVLRAPDLSGHSTLPDLKRSHAVGTAGPTVCTLHSTLRTPHYTLYSTLYTLPSRLHPPHSTLYTLHSPLYTTLHTLHFTFHDLHLAFHTLYFALYTPHSTLYTAHSTLYTSHSTLYTLHFTCFTSLCTWHSARYTFL